MKTLAILCALVATSTACSNGNGKTCIQLNPKPRYLASIGNQYPKTWCYKQSPGTRITFSKIQEYFNVFNNCPFKIWPGILGPGNPENGGFALDAYQSKDVYVQDRWTAGRIWARTNCDANMNCDTGFCKNSVQCSGAGGVPPVSLAEFTLGAQGAGNQDFYDVSMVDGYNLPVFIEPLPGTFNSNGGQYDCKRAGGCFQNLNDPSLCPPELQLKGKSGGVVGCKSACLALNTDQYCCRGANGTPATCNPNNWPKNYAAIFKKACPAAYNYAYDDKTSTFTCRGKNSISPSYKVQFC